MTNLQLLDSFISRTGKSSAFKTRTGNPDVKRIARQVLLREPTTVFRWLRREAAIPQVVVDHMAKVTKARGPFTRIRLAAAGGLATRRLRVKASRATSRASKAAKGSRGATSATRRRARVKRVRA